ncbi:MAG: hypothetical protein R3C10_00615 [Pirellulales bacterium]
MDDRLSQPARRRIARLDAELLLGRSVQCSRIELYTAWDEQVDDDVRTEFRELVKRLRGGTPVALLARIS